MIKVVLYFALLGAAGPMAAQEITVPSGLSMTLQEVRLEQEPAAMARFRFVVPAIKGGMVPFADVVGDIEFLCSDVVVPALAANDWTTGSVVISLAEVAVPFGEPAPEITQYFQPYSIQDSTCLWEPF